MQFQISQHPDPVEEGAEVTVVCSATAKGKKVHYFSWTDGNGVDIEGKSSTSNGVYMLPVTESKLGESKIVVCVVSVDVDGALKKESANYTVHVAGESCMR